MFWGTPAGTGLYHIKGSGTCHVADACLCKPVQYRGSPGTLWFAFELLFIQGYGSPIVLDAFVLADIVDQMKPFKAGGCVTSDY